MVWILRCLRSVQIQKWQTHRIPTGQMRSKGPVCRLDQAHRPAPHAGASPQGQCHVQHEPWLAPHVVHGTSLEWVLRVAPTLDQSCTLSFACEPSLWAQTEPALDPACRAGLVWAEHAVLAPDWPCVLHVAHDHSIPYTVCNLHQLGSMHQMQ